jgi:hypothetical protein
MSGSTLPAVNPVKVNYFLNNIFKCILLSIFLFLKIEEYESITCIDKSGVCETYASACNSGAAINGVNINEVCPRTCGMCDSKQKSIQF